jgi:hypothetical protein
MPLKIGSTDVADVKLGSSQVDAIYQGTNEVWSSSAIELVGQVSVVDPGNAGTYSVDWSSLNPQAGDIVLLLNSQYWVSQPRNYGATGTVTGLNTMERSITSAGRVVFFSSYWGLHETLGRTSQDFFAGASAIYRGYTQILVFRGVDPVTPLDVPYQFASATVNDPFPLAITPVSSGAYVVDHLASTGTSAITVAPQSPTPISNEVTSQWGAAASKTEWSATPVQPSQYLTTGSTFTMATITIALRPL